MSISWPLAAASFADLLELNQVKFMLPRDEQQYSVAGDGSVRTLDLGDPLWAAQATSVPLTLAQAMDIQAVIESLDGSLGSFYLYNPARPYPVADPTGSILGSSTVTINAVGGDNKSLKLEGLPVGYVLTRGDFLSFDIASTSTRALHRIVESATADGSGVAGYFEVRPALFEGTETTIVVTLKKPAALMCMVPGTLDLPLDVISGVLSFSAIQILRDDDA